MRDKKKRQLGAVISLPPAPAQTPNPVTLTVECCAASRTEQPSGLVDTIYRETQNSGREWVGRGGVMGKQRHQG